jgi:hypothetical protein
LSGRRFRKSAGHQGALGANLFKKWRRASRCHFLSGSLGETILMDDRKLVHASFQSLAAVQNRAQALVCLHPSL